VVSKTTQATAVTNMITAKIVSQNIMMLATVRAVLATKRAEVVIKRITMRTMKVRFSKDSSIIK